MFPQVVWLSEHNAEMFGLAGLMMIGSGALQWRNRSAPCPTDLVLRDACLKTRSTASKLYAASILIYFIGGWFSFIQPWLSA